MKVSIAVFSASAVLWAAAGQAAVALDPSSAATVVQQNCPTYPDCGGTGGPQQPPKPTDPSPKQSKP